MRLWLGPFCICLWFYGSACVTISFRFEPSLPQSLARFVSLIYLFAIFWYFVIEFFLSPSMKELGKKSMTNVESLQKKKVNRKVGKLLIFIGQDTSTAKDIYITTCVCEYECLSSSSTENMSPGTTASASAFVSLLRPNLSLWMNHFATDFVSWKDTYLWWQDILLT